MYFFKEIMQQQQGPVHHSTSVIFKPATVNPLRRLIYFKHVFFGGGGGRVNREGQLIYFSKMPVG